MLLKKISLAILLTLTLFIYSNANENLVRNNFEFKGEIPTDKKYSTSKVYKLDIGDELDSENNLGIFNNTTSSNTPVAVQLISNPIEKMLSFKLNQEDKFENIKDDQGQIKNLKIISDLSPNQTERDTVWEIQFDRPIRSSSLSLNSFDNSPLPNLVKIVTRNSIVLNSQGIYGGSINFTETESDYFKVILTHTQPLRLENLRLSESYNDYYYDKFLLFLTVPNTKYFLYSKPQTYFRNNFVNNFNDANPVLINMNSIKMQTNPEFVRKVVIRDIDKDGVPDDSDNCVYTENPDQKDENNNLRGDACDDFDYDGIGNTKDNCMNIPNYDQKDTDRDNMGDACDADGESRFTENNKWLQWAALGFLLVILTTIFVLASQKNSPKL